MVKRLLLILLLGLVALGLASLGDFLSEAGQTKTEALRAARAAEWAKFEPQIREDEAAWKDDPLLAVRDGGDAASVLLAHVRWTGADGGAEGVPPVPEPIAALVTGWGKEWPSHADEVSLDLQQVDLSWLARLHEYGRWDLDAPGSPTVASPLASPARALPSIDDLWLIAKLRLLAGPLGLAGRMGAAPPMVALPGFARAR